MAIEKMAAQSGRILAEDGSTVNIADILGGEETGEKMDIEKMMPHSGRFVKEDGTVVNISGNIGGGGGGQTMEALTITVGDTAYTYDGTEAVSIDIDAAEGEEF